MQVVRSEIQGYCPGVKHAITVAESLADSDRPVWTLGALVHNLHVQKSLESKGIRILISADSMTGKPESPEHLKDALVVIRAHGASPAVEQNLRSCGATVIDATCQKVKSNQHAAAQLAAQSYRVFMAGDPLHAEIAGIKGYTPDLVVINSEIDAQKAAEQMLHENRPEKTALIGQTTLALEDYESIGRVLSHFFPEILILDSICSATRIRQKAMENLCDVVEAIIVVGGRHSANTGRLLLTAQKKGKPAWLVECAEEIPAEICRYTVTGLASGASTPESLVDEVESALISKMGTDLRIFL
ncbi:4-hydroxy-3-methylbut-2-enyl diphosphate reductase [Spirochaetia bacterium]|nr:4-hydroxy-3-methylbut-2-enyl diphosphate reductase [Spirochaetia bacterium]